MTRQVRVNDVMLSVEDEGSGSPIVFIHGWSMSGRFFRRQLEYLRAVHRVVIPDLRGHGNSEKVLHGHTVPNYAADVRALLDDLGIQRPLLVGWSMGAMVAFEFLRAFGADSIAGLAIVDQPPSDFAWDGYEFGPMTIEALREMNEQIQLDQATVVDELIGLMLHRPDELTTSWMRSEILQVPAAISSTILVDQTLRDYREFLPQINVPTLVLFGEDEKLSSPLAGEYIASRVPGARLQTFPQSSHCPFWEESDSFNQAIASFANSLA